MKNKIVDIVIPTYKPALEFRDLIWQLKKQSYPINHILVVNTESDVFPEKFCDEQGVQVCHIKKSEFDHGGTRDMAIRKTDADIVVFMTQDAVPVDDQLVEKLVNAFVDEQIAVAYARQLPKKDCSIIEKYTRQFNYPKESVVKSIEDVRERGIKTFFCSNVCAAYRKDIYDILGGFDKNTIFNEDMILAGKMIFAGYKIAYVADAMVLHSHNYSGIQQFHRNFDLAVSQADHPEVFEGIKSESEGIRLVKQTIRYLISVKKAYLIFPLIYQSGCKYLGYKLGKNYCRLPQWFVSRCTMNTTYWKKKQKKENDN